MREDKWNDFRRQLVTIAVIMAAIVLLEIVGFNGYYFSYSLLNLQPRMLSIQDGLLHDFEIANGKLVALSDDPNVTFPNVDARVERIVLSCKNARPGASGHVYFASDNRPIGEAGSVSYSTEITLYDRTLDLALGRFVTALRFDLTDTKGDRVACADILLNPAASLHVDRIRLTLYACVLLGALTIMLLGRRLRYIPGRLWPHEISRVEWIIIVLLALLAGGTAYWRASSLDPVIYSYGYGDGVSTGYATSDMWFNGDIPKIVVMVSSRVSDRHYITSEHPLISLAIYPPVFLLTRAAGLTVIEAVRLYWAFIAALWTAMLYILLRAIGCRTSDTALFTVLAMTSAAFAFWFAVPEAFSIGSLTIVVALYLAAVAGRTKSPLLIYAVINLISLSMTLTNWMVGILAAILNLPWRRAFIAIAGAFLAATLLWGVEKQAFPAASFFLGSSGRLSAFMHLPTAGRILEVVPSFVSNTMVMPEIKSYSPRPLQRVMTVGGSFPTFSSAAGYLAAAAWLALLGLGAWACFSLWRQSSMIRLAVLITVAQLALHLIFGVEPFLYSLHFLPTLIIIAASVTRTRLRPVGLGMAGVVAVACLINNQWQFAIAATFIRRMGQIAAGF